jgi:hypothetical protein
MGRGPHVHDGAGRRFHSGHRLNVGCARQRATLTDGAMLNSNVVFGPSDNVLSVLHGTLNGSVAMSAPRDIGKTVNVGNLAGSTGSAPH